MSDRHIRAARSAAARLKKVRLYRMGALRPEALRLSVKEMAASFARWSACSFPSIPWCAGTHLTVMVLPRATGCSASLVVSIATSWPGPGLSLVILLMAAWESVNRVKLRLLLPHGTRERRPLAIAISFEKHSRSLLYSVW